MSVPSCPSTGTTNGCVSVAEADAYCTGAPQCTDINKEYNSLSDKKDKYAHGSIPVILRLKGRLAKVQPSHTHMCVYIPNIV